MLILEDCKAKCIQQFTVAGRGVVAGSGVAGSRVAGRVLVVGRVLVGSGVLGAGEVLLLGSGFVVRQRGVLIHSVATN